MKLWGGRFEGHSSQVFESFSNSLHFDRRLLDADITGSQAFARALARVGVLTEGERDELITAFEDIRKASQEASFFEGAEDEDVHTMVIRKLKEQAGALSDKIHTGRSRNEQVSLDTRLWLRAEVDDACTLLLDLMAALLDLADRYPDAVIPGFTHLKRAQAVLWPHYLLAYFEMFCRDQERLEQTRARVNVLPLGSGALAGSGFPFDREAMARDLDFGGISRNSMDVSSDRDFVLDFLFAASMILLHLSRLAEDWILYSSDEFGWLELGDDVTSGSSLMPQKKNPDSLELIRGKCGRVYGCFTSLFVTMKGIPLCYNRDMQEDKEPLFEAADQLRGVLRMARVVAGGVKLKPEVSAAAAAEGWLVATDLAEALARKGVPFHRAHQLTGQLVLHSLKAGKKPADWSGPELAGFAPELDAAMIAYMQPEHGMRTRSVPGGTAPSAVTKALAEARQRLESMRAAM